MNMIQLPKGYVCIRQIDLQRDKKTAWIVNVVALAVMVAMVLAAVLLEPVEPRPAGAALWFEGMLLIAGIIVYMVLHELTHGVLMKYYSSINPTYGFSGLYAYAGCAQAYFDSSSYIIIAFAPIVLLGVALIVLMLCFPKWFWVLYIIQTINVSGSVGDFYVVGLLMRMPGGTLVNDTGYAMTFYAEEGARN